MASIAEIKRRLEKVQKKTTLNAIIDKIVLSDRQLKILKEQEFEKGERPNGSIIGTYKSKSYELYKASLNPEAGGVVDLMLTGSFVDEMYVSKGRKVGHYIFKSNDEKSNALQKKYGKDIMGLNQETFETVNEKVYRDKFIKELKRITGL